MLAVAVGSTCGFWQKQVVRSRLLRSADLSTSAAGECQAECKFRQAVLAGRTYSRVTIVAVRLRRSSSSCRARTTQFDTPA
jgi:hypothetical protein